MIQVNNELSTLVMNDQLIEGYKPIDKYMAKNLELYYGYTWGGFNPPLSLLMKMFPIKKYEKYEYSIIVPNGTDEETVIKYIEDYKRKNGCVVDYVLEETIGHIDIIHYTHKDSDIISIQENGYSAPIALRDDYNYSFGPGLYCLDLNNIENIDIIPKGYFVGKYNGLYFRCIYDLANAEKDGSKTKRFQEIIIPFSTKEIKWNI